MDSRPADQGAEQTVAAVLDGIRDVHAHAKNDADAGKGRVAVQQAVHHGHQHGGDRRLDGAPADVQPEIGTRKFRHNSFLLQKSNDE